MGSFPTKGKVSSTSTSVTSASRPPLEAFSALTSQTCVTTAQTTQAVDSAELRKWRDEAQSRPSLSTRASGSVMEEAMHSQTMRPGTTRFCSSPCPCADADNPIRVPCTCSSVSLECETDGLAMTRRHSLPRILGTPGSAGITSPGTESLPASVPHVVLNPRRGYIGEEIDLVTAGDMDDFALASIGDTAGVLGWPPSAARASGGSVDPFESGTADSKVGVEHVVDFVSFRRPGLKSCARCQSDLPARCNFCPHCGCPAMSTGEDSTGGLVSYKEVYSGNSASAISAASSQELNGYVVSFSTTPVTPWLEVPPTLRGFNSSRMSPVTPTFARSVANAALVSFKDGETSPRAYHTRAYRRRIRMDLSSRGLLGRGAAGAVYKAFDIRTGQQMAVKVMDLKNTDAEDLVSIRNELRHLARLRHANIVEYFGCRVEEQVATPTSSADESSSFFSQQDQDLISLVPPSPSNERKVSHKSSKHGMRIFILMERLECGTLAEAVRSFPGGLPESTAQVYTVQLVAVILYVHQCGLTHRDIKPANVLLASDGTIKVADFGCATVHAACGFLPEGGADDDASSLYSCKDKKVAGTPAYMPPETISIIAEEAEDDAMTALYHRAQDLWALGCTVHQLLTGEEPWASIGSSVTPFALLMTIQGKSFPISDKVSDMARDFLKLCFELDPHVRAKNSLLLSHHPFLSCV